MKIALIVLLFVFGAAFLLIGAYSIAPGLAVMICGGFCFMAAVLFIEMDGL